MRQSKTPAFLVASLLVAVVILTVIALGVG